MALAQVQESVAGSRAIPLTPDSPVNPLQLMHAPPHGIAYEAASVTQRSLVHIDIPPMPSSVLGLESYIQTLQRGMEEITPRELETLVGFLNPQGRVTQMTIAQAIFTL